MKDTLLSSNHVTKLSISHASLSLSKKNKQVGILLLKITDYYNVFTIFTAAA